MTQTLLPSSLESSEDLAESKMSKYLDILEANKQKW